MNFNKIIFTIGAVFIVIDAHVPILPSTWGIMGIFGIVLLVFAISYEDSK